MRKDHPDGETRTPHKPWIVAHRGSSAYAVENSLAACQLAAEQGVDFLEVDVRATRDHILVLHHNRGIRIGTKRYWIDKHTFSEIKKHKPSIATLEEVIQRFGDKVGFNVDIKQPAIEHYVVELFRRYRVEQPIIVDSNNFAILWRFKELYPTAMTSFYMAYVDSRDILYSIIGRILYKTLPKILKYFAPYIIVWRVKGRLIDAVSFDPPSMVNERIVEELRSQGVLIFGAVANSERDMKKLLALGVDGIKTDRPDLAKRIINGESTYQAHLLPIRILRRIGGKVKRVLTREVPVN